MLECMCVRACTGGGGHSITPVRWHNEPMSVCSGPQPPTAPAMHTTAANRVENEQSVRVGNSRLH